MINIRVPLFEMAMVLASKVQATALLIYADRLEDPRSLNILRLQFV